MAGCITTVGSLNYHKTPEQEVRITQSNDIARYFKGEKLPVEEIGERLEDILDKDFSRVFALEIDIASMHYGDTGHLLVLTKRGSLDIIYSESFFRDINDKEKQRIEDLAEAYGPDWSSKDSVDEKAEKPYSAYMMRKGGYALQLLLGHYIKINPKGDTLYSRVHTMAHEGTHTLVYNNMGLLYSAEFLFAYLDWIDNDEIVAIHETACNVVADRVAEYFKQHHLVKGSGLYNRFERGQEFSRQYAREIGRLLQQYSAVPEAEREWKAPGLMMKFETRVRERFGFKSYDYNEARLAIAKRYSGNEKVNNELNYIYDRLGPKDFVRIIPYLFSIKDLDTVHSSVRKGVRDFETVVGPVKDNLYLIPREDMRNIF